MIDTNSYTNLGEIHIADRVVTSTPDMGRIRTIIWMLAGCLALMNTGFGIVMPVFARRLDELGSGVQGMGIMLLAFALAQFITSPFLGTLGDRIGRKPLVLGSLVTFIIANIGLVLAPTTRIFIMVRAFEGGLTAGLLPAAMSMVGDLVPENIRGKWVGILMGSMGAGFVLGPVLGGVLYDGWGFEAPFIFSAVLAVFALALAIALVPETRTRRDRLREKMLNQREGAQVKNQTETIWNSLPRPLHVFGTLLFIDFMIVFVFSYIQPQMMFYFYKDLEWTTVQFGVIVGFFGLAMVFGQFFLAQLSDKWGRKIVIVIGLVLFAALPGGLVTVISFWTMALISVVAGLGNALLSPALSAFYLDITSQHYRSRIMGIKGSASSMGGVAGPLLIVFAAAWLSPRGVFISATGVVVFAVVVTIIGLKKPRMVETAGDDMLAQLSSQRSIAAQVIMRTIVLQARTARGSRKA